MITRASVKAGLLRNMLIRAGRGAELWSEARLRASLARAMASHRRGDLWLFAYGSLIWNPMIEVRERRVASVRGLHRSFCMRLAQGRGSEQRPGLMLALDRGGCCDGVAYRIGGRIARRELDLLWRREMLTGSYVPSWVTVRAGGSKLTALTFVINRRHKNYTGPLPVETVAETLATARGELGSCAEYFHNTRAGLTAVGIRDKGLDRLARLMTRLGLDCSSVERAA